MDVASPPTVWSVARTNHGFERFPILTAMGSIFVLATRVTGGRGPGAERDSQYPVAPENGSRSP